MDLRPIPARDWADWYTQELCASFPACECKPLEAIRALAAEGRYELLGLYDGAALLGYATLWSTPEWPDYVLLDYLGVTAARRNGGLGSVILEKVRASGKNGYGFDAYKEEYCDMVSAGIIDPAKVTRSALENAASVSAMVLTTESLVADKPEPPAPAAPAGGEMGGMY